MNPTLLKTLKLVFPILLGVVLLYLVFSNQQKAYLAQCQLDNIPAASCSLIQKLVADFKTVRPFWLLVIIIAFMMSNLSRAIRWNMMLHPMGYTPRLVNSFFSVTLGNLVNLGIPRSGELARATTMSRYERVPVVKLMGTIIVERAIDVACLGTMFGLAFLLEYDTIWGYISANSAKQGGFITPQKLVLYGGIGLVLLAVSGFLFRKRMGHTSAYQKIKKLILDIWQGFSSVSKLAHPVQFLMHTVFIWAMYFFMTYLCFRAFPPTEHLSALAGLMVFVFGSLGIVLPSPGGMGTFQAFTIAALGLYGLSGSDCFSFANILFFTINIFGNIIFGIIALVGLPIVNSGRSGSTTA